MEKALISIICPVFNEEQTIPKFYRRVSLAIQELRQSYNFELIFTNNASTDRTLEILHELRAKDSDIKIITLSRNFGYQSSLLSGLRNSTGKAVIIIDSDCEDPPEMIPTFIAGWEKGFDLVYGVRQRRVEFIGIRFMRKLFYRVMRLIADNDFILDMAEFSLFSHRMKEVVLSNFSTFPFIRAELGFAGFKRLGIPYGRERRVAGKTHYSFTRMAQFGFGGMLSSSTFFLRLSIYTGIPLGLLNVAWGVASLFLDLGATLPLVLSLNMSFLVFSTAFIAVYIARVYKNGLRRPVYVIDQEKSSMQCRDWCDDATTLLHHVNLIRPVTLGKIEARE